MMKLLATSALLFITLNIFSQNNNKDSWGISIGTGQSGIYTFGKVYVGGPDHEGLADFDAGFNYYHPLNNFLYIESGLFFHHNKIKITPGVYPGVVDLTPKYSNLNLFYIPVNLKLMFLKYFFVDGGMLLNMDVSTHSDISNQTALGADFGLGIEIPVFKHYSLILNPFVNIHELYKLDRHDLGESIISDGVRLSLRFK